VKKHSMLLVLALAAGSLSLACGQKSAGEAAATPPLAASGVPAADVVPPVPDAGMADAATSAPAAPPPTPPVAVVYPYPVYLPGRPELRPELRPVRPGGGRQEASPAPGAGRSRGGSTGTGRGGSPDTGAPSSTSAGPRHGESGSPQRGRGQSSGRH
jgi:hypothetical protein